MITAEFKEHKHNKTITVKIKGHAESAPEGKDLICAASSAFGFQSMQAVENMFLAEWLSKKPLIRFNKGDVRITLKPKNEYYTVVINMLQVVAIGFQVLEAKYPEHVQLTAFVESQDFT